MIRRIVTLIVLLPTIVAVIVLGDMWLRGLLAAFSLLALFEFYRAVSDGKGNKLHLVGYAFTVVYFLLIASDFLTLVPIVFMIIVACITVMFYRKIDLKDCVITICGFFYIPVFFSFIYLVREQSLFFVWLIFVSASVSDTFGYLIGKNWGKHRLVNTASPTKSIEGCVAGIVGAAIGGVIYYIIFINISGSPSPLTPLETVAVSIIGAVFSQFGDIFASAIKRYVGIKDFGQLLPGHGGVLDRFDGILITAPIIYMVMLWI
ncbi:MAG: phosphatidate cytidylyltransferase [Turicibacter sp.]|nr:phosphatidate cytidylyltransferase [Turicibacter sp.]